MNDWISSKEKKPPYHCLVKVLVTEKESGPTWSIVKPGEYVSAYIKALEMPEALEKLYNVVCDFAKVDREEMMSRHEGVVFEDHWVNFVGRIAKCWRFISDDEVKELIRNDSSILD
jgi:hypothetical protein